MAWLERNSSWIGWLTLPLLVGSAYMALVWSPPDIHMGQDMRLMYVHVPTIWTAYVALTVSLCASLTFLWKKDLRWDNLAVASAEIGVALTALAIVAGAIWGKLTWGVYWTWDPRLTTTAVLLVIFVGYLLLRALTEDPWTRAKQSAIVAVIGFIDIPVVHFSVLWWRSLHQGPTFLQPNLGDPIMDDRMEVTLIVSTIAFTVLYAFLLSKRLALARLEREHEAIDWSEESSRLPELEPAHAR